MHNESQSDDIDTPTYDTDNKHDQHDVTNYFELNPDRVTIYKDILLGSGHYGKVYFGIVRLNNIANGLIPVAVKTIKAMESDALSKANTITKQIDALRTELNILACIQQSDERPHYRHPNLIRLLGTMTQKENVFSLMTEYCEYGSLDRYLQEKYRNKQFVNQKNSIDHCKTSNNGQSMTRLKKKNRNVRITTDDILSFAEQIASAMDYLASKNILHRDVALRNIFIKSNMIIKLGDFGLARKLVEGKTNYAQSTVADVPIRYMALESLLSNVYTIESEVWSFGVVLWELFTFAQRLPYEKELPNLKVWQLKNYLRNGSRLNPPIDVTPEPIRKLMLSTWSDNSQRRPSFKTCQAIIRNVRDNACTIV